MGGVERGEERRGVWALGGWRGEERRGDEEGSQGGYRGEAPSYLVRVPTIWHVAG